MARKIVLRSFLAPGDIVMLTAAVRDLHRSYPGQFITDVRTPCPDLWLHNPYITRLSEGEPDVQVIDCNCPLINQSNAAPYHCVHGFIHFLNERLGLRIHPRQFGGDIHLSREEASMPSQVQQLAGTKFPFWLVVSGGKFDFTAKWWDPQRFQQVVEHFRDRIQFVQVGEIGHHHPRLHGTVDLRGRTDLRELIRLVYHAQGVLCGVTGVMHLAAAVQTYPNRPKLRPAVIIAGGREPTHWEAYPHHQFIHTVGALPCCESGGCWRSRVRPLGDGEEGDRSLCVDVVGSLPKCMHMITADHVIRRIETYFVGGMTRYLNADEVPAARRAVTISERKPNFDSTLNLVSAAKALTKRSAKVTSPPAAMRGCGVVICADPEELLPSVRAAKRNAPQLPIQCFTHDVLEGKTSRELARLEVTVHFVDPRISLLVHALRNTAWRTVVLLTRSRAPVLRGSLTAGFSDATFARTGTLFWKTPRRLLRTGLWHLLKLPAPKCLIHSGCAVLDRFRVWRAIELWTWMCEHPYIFVEESGSELGAFHLATNFLTSAELPKEQRVSGNENAELPVFA